jgi:hypothetical protein
MKADFNKTTQLIFNFEDERASYPFPYEDPLWEYSEDSWVQDKVSSIEKSFKKEYNMYIKKGLYFFGCSNTVYSETYDLRLNIYLSEFKDNHPISFIRQELLEEGVLVFKNNYIERNIKKNISTSLYKRISFLQEKAKIEGYVLTILPRDNFDLKPMESYSKDFDPIDLSDSSHVQKVIYLNELGVLDFLRKNNCFSSSVNNLAQVLSSFTGTKTRTLQSCLNPMFNKQVKQDNNPYFKEKNSLIVKKNLNDLGFDNPKP